MHGAAVVLGVDALDEPADVDVVLDYLWGAATERALPAVLTPQLVGSGQGSVPTRDIAAELPALAAHITASDPIINAVPAPLRDVERAWTAPLTGQRIVFLP